MRGEYPAPMPPRCRFLELPPRARRILGAVDGAGHVGGTTSACAENTRRLRPGRSRHGNYLRVRGEYRVSPVRGCSHSELPPRARRIRVSSRVYLREFGTTSACAENTKSPGCHPPLAGNYLRVRGEYPHKCCTVATTAELPPRARRIHPWGRGGLVTKGTTSACAENTGELEKLIAASGNYLRVRGEYRKT